MSPPSFFLEYDPIPQPQPAPAKIQPWKSLARTTVVDQGEGVFVKRAGNAPPGGLGGH